MGAGHSTKGGRGGGNSSTLFFMHNFLFLLLFLKYRVFSVSPKKITPGPPSPTYAMVPAKLLSYINKRITREKFVWQMDQYFQVL
jgi:hypothetical protein